MRPTVLVRTAIIALAAQWAAAAAAPAATPVPAPAHLPVRAPAFVIPKKAVHAQFILEVNGKGQVTKVRSRVSSGDRTFDAITAGNVVQTFVRKPDGKAIAGVYRMHYDYNPQTKNVRRTVELIHAGGVDADAPGLVDRMAAVNRTSLARIQKALAAAAKRASPKPAHAAAPKPAHSGAAKPGQSALPKPGPSAAAAPTP